MGINDISEKDLTKKRDNTGRRVKATSVRCNERFLDEIAVLQPSLFNVLIGESHHERGPSQKSVARTCIHHLEKVLEDDISGWNISEDQKRDARMEIESIKDNHL